MVVSLLARTQLAQMKSVFNFTLCFFLLVWNPSPLQAISDVEMAKVPTLFSRITIIYLLFILKRFWQWRTPYCLVVSMLAPRVNLCDA